MKDRKMVRNKQHWFTKGKSSMAKMIAFSDEKLALWMREFIGYRLLQEHFWHCLPQPPYRKTRVIASGWVNNKVDEAAEWSVVQRNWRLIRTAALHEGSMLRLILFNLFINTLDNDTEHILSKSGGDTGQTGWLVLLEDTATMQSNPDKLDKCTNRHLVRSQSKGNRTWCKGQREWEFLHYEHDETLEQIVCGDQKWIDAEKPVQKFLFSGAR